MDNLTDKNWTHYLTRPFTLFGSSLWYTWYADYAQRFTTEDISDMVCIEETMDVVRNYRRLDNLDHLKAIIGRLALDEREKCLDLLGKAIEYNKEAKEYLDNSKKFHSLEDAVLFFYEIALHGTILPHFIIEGFLKFKKEDKEIVILCEKLRGVSYYPKILTEIIIPLAIEKLEKMGVVDPEESLKLFCIDEVLSGDSSKLKERKKQRKTGKLFIYQMVGRKMDLTWHHNTMPFVLAIEHLDVKVKELKGSIGHRGHVTGKTRIVLSFDGKGIEFNKGDILVSINSNPNLMHLITQAGAIITDEGGITCHAAIISRELKIPCIIGTKIATKVLKDGDLVEVDANNGIVKIIK